MHFSVIIVIQFLIINFRSTLSIYRYELPWQVCGQCLNNVLMAVVSSDLIVPIARWPSQPWAIAPLRVSNHCTEPSMTSSTSFHQIPW